MSPTISHQDVSARLVPRQAIQNSLIAWFVPLAPLRLWQVSAGILHRRGIWKVDSLHNPLQPHPLLAFAHLRARERSTHERILQPRLRIRLREDELLEGLRKHIQFAAGGLAGDVADEDVGQLGAKFV